VGICPWKCGNKLTINQKSCKAKLENFIELLKKYIGVNNLGDDD